MLDIKFIRENAKAVKKNVKLRNMNVDVDALLRLDAERLSLLQESEKLRQERNDIAETMKAASKGDRPALVERGKELKQLLSLKEADLAAAEEPWMTLLLQVPNMAHPDAPVGEGEADNVVVRSTERQPGGLPTQKMKNPKDHLELGEALDVLDFERGAKVAGAKFYYLKGKLAILEQALIRFALDECVKNGFMPMSTPDLARDEIIAGTGFTPRGPESQIYSLENSDLSLIGTSEITVGGYHRGETLDVARLPLRYAAVSHCFRTESGAYGRESYGLYRVHQFSKVEMFVFAAPEQSETLLQELLRMEEEIWNKLEIPFRVVDICTGDLGAPAVRKYDLEAWMPGKTAEKGRGDWGEVTSASNCTDFQARRLGIKVKREDGSTEFLHTLNGTAVSLARALIAILENGQQEDGTITIPNALVPYCGFDAIP